MNLRSEMTATAGAGADAGVGAGAGAGAGADHARAEGVGAGADLSALAWVHDELRRSLEGAHKALKRALRDAVAAAGSDLDAVEPALLRGARMQLHQSVGALELIGQPGAATVLRASEALVQRFVARPEQLTPQHLASIERASFALLDFLGQQLAGKAVSALALFPQYRALQEAVGAARIHPADLWAFEWQWRALPTDATVAPCQADARSRAALESLLLDLLRKAEPIAAAARMSELCAGLGAGAQDVAVATLWKLASAVFEAQAGGWLGFDVYSKRVASRLLAQLRSLERGEVDVPALLARDLLFFCAQSAAPDAGLDGFDGRDRIDAPALVRAPGKLLSHASLAPRLAAVHAAYALGGQLACDYANSRLGHHDPAVVAQARKRVAAAKDAWSGAAAAELHRLAGLGELFALVGESLKKLFPLGEEFAAELQQAALQTQHSEAAPTPVLAMEVATSLLYVEAVLEDGAFDAPEQAARVRRLAQRLAGVCQGGAAQPLEAWMEALYRRVSDRQTLGSVVHELRASLGEAEALLDQYFRNPAEPAVLIPVPTQLAAIRGVLGVLGMDHASAALRCMRDEIDALAATGTATPTAEADAPANANAQSAQFERLAGNLGALGFLIDMLSVQPHMAQSLFSFDPATGVLRPVMGRVEGLAGPAARVASGPAVRVGASALVAPPPRTPAVAGVVASPAPAHDEFPFLSLDFSAADDAAAEPRFDAAEDSANPPDADLRGVFLDEAREVLASAVIAHAEWVEAPHNPTHASELRRAFHTLKGSARMVGLDDFGAAAWACEQVCNRHLTQARLPAGGHAGTQAGNQAGTEAHHELHGVAPALLDFTAWSLRHLAAWVEEIAAGQPVTHASAAVTQAVTRLGASVARFDADARDERASQAATAELAEFGELPESAGPSELSRPPAGDDFTRTSVLPPNLPSASDLDFDLSTGLHGSDLADLSELPDRVDPDALLSDEAALKLFDPALFAPAQLEPDLVSPDLIHPFDRAPVEPLPRAEVVQEHSADVPFELIDFDLDFGAIAAPPSLLPAPAQRAEVDTTEAMAPAPRPPAVPAEPEPELKPEPEPEPEPEFATSLAAFDTAAADIPDEQVKHIGPLRIGLNLFNIFLNEADELSRRLSTELAEWSMELHRPIGEAAVAFAHSLAGSSATVGFNDLSQLARRLERGLSRSRAAGAGTLAEAQLFGDAAEDIRRLLHQFAAGFLKEPSAQVLVRLAAHELESPEQVLAAAPEDTVSAALALGADPGSPAPAPTPTPTHAAPLVINALQPLGALPVAPARPATAAQRGRLRVDGGAIAHSAEPVDALDSLDAVDALDAELFGFFREEAEDLLPQLAAALRDWSHRPTELAPPAACMRALHTLKGSARLAGAMRLGEMVHRLEGRIERLLAQPPVTAPEVQALQAHGDALMQMFEALGVPAAPAEAPPEFPAFGAVALPHSGLFTDAAAEALLGEFEPPTRHDHPLRRDTDLAADTDSDTDTTPDAAPLMGSGVVSASASTFAGPSSTQPATAIDWSRFAPASATPRVPVERVAQSAVRVRAPVLDRLVNLAGEVSIARSRIESGVAQMKASLADLGDNLERLRTQLRELEFHGERQMTSRLEANKASAQDFDPLEFDRFTRFQEVTRMMAESVHDVATVQRSLQRAVDGSEDELVLQARMTRELQDDLLRTRMVEFDGLSERLYRVVRQAAKETGKSVRLDIVGGSVEIDRGVLDRITPAFEHLLRNSVVHGIETPAARLAAGKDVSGVIVVALAQEGNEVSVEFRDDGAGLDLERIRTKGVAAGLLDAWQWSGDAELANLIFTPGFTTTEVVTELAGRGIGMDVVRSEVDAIGGRIETATTAGQGTSFKLVVPLTTAVTQVVMLRCGTTRVAVPTTLVEVVRRVTPEQLEAALASGSFADSHPASGSFAESVSDTDSAAPPAAVPAALPFYCLGALLQLHPLPESGAERSRSVVVIRSAKKRIALQVDEVLGNQEVVVKHLGPQLAQLPGLAGITLLASGAVTLIYNLVALATLYGVAAHAATEVATRAATHARQVRQASPATTWAAAGDAADFAGAPPTRAPLVMVVDDSITVRRVTQRLLEREGYRVVLAKDGMDALTRLAEELPCVLLSDIEMPRMDGFDLVRNLRADARLHDLPVIMITSRIAEKHREHASELGVRHYLGKPYVEEDLLALVAQYVAAAAAAAAQPARAAD